ncbi:MAG: HEAT repeat domain-containing protein [Phycisphaerales bacterium]|nr:HEAT repeat domain-containing protein [Phycisphaerales bacterium]
MASVPVSVRRRAVRELQRQVDATRPVLRANAIEMLRYEIEPLRKAVLEGFRDPNEGVRFASLMTAGRAGLCGVAPAARSLMEDSSASVRAAVIFLLATCGEPVDQTSLAQMILSDDRTTRTNAAMVLGEIGNPTAKPLLREAMQRPLPLEDEEVIRATELMLAEALVQLGDRRQLEAIRAAFFAPASQSGLTALASQMAGRLQDRTLIPAMGALALSDGPRKAGPELRLIAAEAVARMDSELTLTDLAVSFSENQSPEVRMQAAAVLAWGMRQQGLDTLKQLLNDDHPRVRIAAAGAILSRAAAVAGRRPPGSSFEN